jgi:predicted ferric reductase
MLIVVIIGRMRIVNSHCYILIHMQLIYTKQKYTQYPTNRRTHGLAIYHSQ